jgi:hypothetical protein
METRFRFTQQLILSLDLQLTGTQSISVGQRGWLYWFPVEVQAMPSTRSVPRCLVLALGGLRA